MQHVPQLTKSLILTRKLDDEGYNCIYGDNSWKITKGSLVVAKGTKSRTLYMPHITIAKDHVICVTKQISLSLWHCQLGHMSNFGIKTLSHFGYVLASTFQKC